MRWLVLIILFLALRLFGVDATWAGAIAYIVFLGMGQSRRSMLIKPPSNESVPPTPVVGDVPPIDLKQLTEDIDQILIILRRALRTPPGRSALELDKATEDRVHVETLLDFALSSVWPRIKEENAWVRYGNPKDSELVREFDRLYSAVPLCLEGPAWPQVHCEHALWGVLQAAASAHSVSKENQASNRLVQESSQIGLNQLGPSLAQKTAASSNDAIEPPPSDHDPVGISDQHLATHNPTTAPPNMFGAGEGGSLSLRTRADIGTGVAAGLLLSTGTLVGAALVSPSMLLDAAVILVLTFGVYRRSPICAAMLCAYWIVNFTTTLLPDIHANVALLPVSVGILVLFAFGLRGCFVERQIWLRQRNRLSLTRKSNLIASAYFVFVLAGLEAVLLFWRIGFGSFTMVPADEILAAEIRRWRVGLLGMGSVALGIGILRGGLIYRLIGQLYLCFLAYEMVNDIDASAAVHLSANSPKPIHAFGFMIGYGAMFWLLSDVGTDKDKSALGGIALFLSLLIVFGFYLQSS